MGVTCDHPSQNDISGGRDGSVRVAGLDELEAVDNDLDDIPPLRHGANTWTNE